MNGPKPTRTLARPPVPGLRQERGSALVMAIFVLVLLAGMGAALLFVSETEVKMSQVDMRSKQVFYISEAGLEDGRETLRVTNLQGATAALRGSLNDELTAAAGANGVINFDPATLAAVYDSAGNVTGFTGYGDDVPLRATTSFSGGKYAAFLTNDPIDGKTSLNDTNDRVMITAVGTGTNRALEVVQAIVERNPFPQMPATITMIGPLASFDGGNSNAKQYTGTDCAIPGLALPVVGTIGSASEASAELGVHKPSTYTSGAATGLATVSDVNATIDPSWKKCDYLHDLARQVRAAADVVGNSSTPSTSLGTSTAPKIVYIEGDYSISGGLDGGGLLWVTGTLTFSGNASWSGVLFTVGKGDFERSGGGNGVISGANLVANVAGPDRLMWTADDCSGPDGVVGTSDDGAAIATYNNSGGGTGLTQYCSSAISTVEEQFPLAIVGFRQR
ncbi:MAG TPA: pilus assembly PilX N-terminal domain-containing protein [Candidatus Polarisedimenticolia bacterium]|nr:pilus assembly PilX N-terminal domain-containing protein [Candidatus Polarisedimenticolia bacterium]